MEPIWADLGLFLTPPETRSPLGAWKSCNNVRVYEHCASARNIGWQKYLAQQLNGPVLGIFEFVPSNGARKLVFATLTDLYQNSPGSATVTYITPRYNTGTASAAGTAVTGVGTLWLANVKAGDQISFGSATQDSIAATWYTVQTVNNDLSITLTASAGAIGNGPYTIRKLFTGQVRDLWFAETFPRAGHVTPNPADRFYITNGLDSIVEWDGSATAVTEVSGTLGFKARYIHRYKNMMIYGYINVGGEIRPYEIRNSLPGFPLNMASVGAGVFTVSPGSDPIQQLETIGDELSIYTDSAIVQAQFVEAPVYFAFRTATQKTGLLASRLLANFGDHHRFLGADAEYMFDGVKASQINSHVWTEGLRTLDPGRLEQCFAAFDDQYGDLYWAVARTTDVGFGTKGSPDFAYTEHYLEGLHGKLIGEEEEGSKPFAKRDFPFFCVGTSEQTTTLTWNQMVGNWTQQTMRWNDKFLAANFPLILAGRGDGFVYVLNTVDNHDGVAFPSFVSFTRHPTSEGGKAQRRGKALIARVYPLARHVGGGVYSLAVTTTVYDKIDEVGNSVVQQFPLDGSGNRFVTPYRRGVYFDLTFGTNGSTTGQPWDLMGWDVDLRAGGER